MKKFLTVIFVILMISVNIEGNLLDKIQKIDILIQEKKFKEAENEATKLLLDPNISSDERASVENLLNDLSRKKIENQQSDIQNIISNNVTSGNSEDSNTLITMEDISDGSKFKTYDEYEKAAIETKNPDIIFKMANLYFRDGLYQRAINVAMKDKTNSLSNLYVVAIASRLIGKYEQSISYYDKILALHPMEMEARLGRGIAYKTIGEFEKALSDLRSYANSNGNVEVNTTIRELQILINNNK